MNRFHNGKKKKNRLPDLPQNIKIKYELWNMASNDQDNWSFCHVILDKEQITSLYKTDIVVPNFLHKGLCEFLPCFCASYENTRDIEIQIHEYPSRHTHALEQYMVPTAIKNGSTDYHNDIMEMYIGYFIGITDDPYKPPPNTSTN